MTDSFEYLLKELGPPYGASPLSPDALRALSGKLPPGLLQFLSEIGASVWLEGRFQFCDPLKYRSVVKTLLRGDLQFDPERTLVYGYTAFGELYLWNEEFQALEINLPLLWAVAPVTEPNWEPRDPDIVLASRLSVLHAPHAGDWNEDSPSAPFMFKRVRKALGPLSQGEVFAFVPALELAGVARADNVQRTRALEQFAILAQLGNPQLFDYSSGRQVPVRVLGAPAESNP